MAKEIVERVRKAIFGVLNCWDVNEDAQREIISTAILPEIKQARSEVLAACKGTVEVFIQEIGKFSDEFGKKRPFKTWDREDWEAAGLRLLTDVQDALDKLQPASSDLEALLREKELAVRYQVQTRLDALQASILHEENTERLLELEKARAEGKG